MRGGLATCGLMVCVTVAGVVLYHKSVRRSQTDAGWTESLRAVASGADRLIIRDMDSSGKGARTDFEIRGADQIRGLFEQIDIDAGESGFHCMCDGDYWFHIYRGEQEVMTIGYHHGKSLRWHDGQWEGDGMLTAASQESLPRWFKDNGYPALQEAREAVLAEERRQAEAVEKFVAEFPEQARECFGYDERAASDPVEGDGAMGQKLAAAVGNPRQLAVSVCRALGTLQGYEAEWTLTGPKERRALAAVRTVGVNDFLAALDELRQDRNAMRGAARVFFFEDFADRLDPETRVAWTVRLAEVVLEDDVDDNKQIVLGRLGGSTAEPVRVLLRRVFGGEVGKDITRQKNWMDEPGLRRGAALMLAAQGDETIREKCKDLLAQATQKQDVAALEVCLALLGDPSYIKTEHFQLQSGHIGLGQLKAIERYEGKFGMEALVKGGIHHPWGRVRDEALLVFERITGNKMTAGEIEDWWEVEHEGQRNRPQPILRLSDNSEQLRCVVYSPDGAVPRNGRQRLNSENLGRGNGLAVAHASRTRFHRIGRRLPSRWSAVGHCQPRQNDQDLGSQDGQGNSHDFRT